MAKINYLTNKGANEEVHGSDTRLNVSARADSREFYVSRDQGQVYVLHINDDDAAAADIIAYLRNDSTSKSVFVRAIEFSSENTATCKLAYGDSATASGGSALTPTNLNKASSNAADVTARGNGAVGTVASSTEISAWRVIAGTQYKWEEDGLILGQNDNIIITLEAAGATGDIDLDIYFYLDTLE